MGNYPHRSVARKREKLWKIRGKNKKKGENREKRKEKGGTIREKEKKKKNDTIRRNK